MGSPQVLIINSDIRERLRVWEVRSQIPLLALLGSYWRAVERDHKS